MLVVGLSACASRLPEPQLPQEAIVRAPEITVDPASGFHSVEIEVLVYNVAGLPWPLKSNRGKAMTLIGDALGDLRAKGREPDIVMIQEGFTPNIKHLIRRSGYPNWVRGPRAGDMQPNYSERANDEFKAESYFWKGERLGKVFGSGLYILSNWPILGKELEPFYRHECAGFDCASNKGILAAAIWIPFMPGYLEVMNTHLNSRGSAGVPEERSLYAHNLQIDHIDAFVLEGGDSGQPAVFGGDFNMKNSRQRLDYADRDAEDVPDDYDVAIHYCVELVSDCEVGVGVGSDEPWLDTQDLQGWSHGKYVSIRAIEIREMFDEIQMDAPKIKGRRSLSDHTGRLVRYRLTWNPKEIPPDWDNWLEE